MGKITDKYTQEQIQEMRGWIADCSWDDLEPEDVYDLTDEEVIDAVSRHFDGGLKAFDLEGI